MQEGTSREELGREQFVARVWDWRDAVRRHRSSSSSSDSARHATTSRSASRSTRGTPTRCCKVFVTLYEKGYIYRDRYLVNWDPGSRSAISDLEVEDREVTDALYYIDYPLESGSGAITVATVRPETMLADTAIAVHPDDERYRRLIGETAILPLVGRRLKIIADEYVKPEFGTGALKITPGHDPNDFEIGRRHGLAEISVIGEDGRMNEQAGPPYTGMRAADAQAAIVATLREQGLLRAHRGVHAHRPVLASLRGADRAARLAAVVHADGRARRNRRSRSSRVGRSVSIPSGGARVYLDWMENIRPWCVSRQLWWGHQIPVWYRGEETHVGVSAPEGDGWDAGPRRSGHLVLQRAVAVRDARLARARPPSWRPSIRPTR